MELAELQGECTFGPVSGQDEYSSGEILIETANSLQKSSHWILAQGFLTASFEMVDTEFIIAILYRD